MSLNPIIDDITGHAIVEIIKYIKGWKTDSFIPLISTWAEENRWLPPGQTELPGQIDHTIAPHLVEIQDCFHPDSGIQQVSVMKGTQALITTAIENAIGHSIKYGLHNILYIISTKNIGRVRSSAAIDVMIDNSGLKNCMKPISTRMKRKLADSTFYKEMSGGRRLMITSWNSIADAKSISWDLIIMDELEEAPYELKGQGDPEAIFAARGITIRGLKIAKISTPTNVMGRINVNFLEGDQRYYRCQCPLCGELQVLQLKAMGRDYGLTARSEMAEGVSRIIPGSVYYLCRVCRKNIFEYQKGDMLNGGSWLPTATPVNEKYRSYQISNLMSPIMFFSWGQVMQQFAETDYGQRITKWKEFVINILGEPWESRSSKDSWRNIQSRAESYIFKEVPPGGLIITGGADVHKNFIVLKVVAWGRDMESWIIDYVTFDGETSNKNNQVWEDLRTFLKSRKYKLDNIQLPIAMTAIDSGYNPGIEAALRKTDIITEHVVYEFVAMTPRTIAARGNPKLKGFIIKQERIYRGSLLKKRYDVAVNELKDETFIKIDLPIGAPGGIHFSKNLPEAYFRGFASEIFTEIAPGDWQWKKIFERNEPLDTYILARAAAENIGIPEYTEYAWDIYQKNLFTR